MGSIHKMEGESINITEADIVKVIFQGGVCSVVKSLADLRGVVTTGVAPSGKNYQNPVRNSGVRKLTDCEERERTRRQRHGQSERWEHQ